jgi:hypothetical protein
VRQQRAADRLHEIVERVVEVSDADARAAPPQTLLDADIDVAPALGADGTDACGLGQRRPPACAAAGRTTEFVAWKIVGALMPLPALNVRRVSPQTAVDDGSRRLTGRGKTRREGVLERFCWWQTAGLRSG